MKRIIKAIVLLCILGLTISSTLLFKVRANNEIPTHENTLHEVNTSIEIKNGMYDDYTNCENTDFYNNSIFTYNLEDYGYCGFNMEYYQRKNLFQKSKARIHGDDPIVDLVPKELFMYRGKHTYVGLEYGFFVNTRPYENNGDYDTANYVDVFIFDVHTEFSQDKLTFELKPLFVFQYIYISDYIFYKNSSPTIFGVELTLDAKKYTTYSDVVIPLPVMGKDRVSCQYGNVYMQDYEAAQVNKDLYAIKDTSTYMNLNNANNPNIFDDEYDIEKDYGYRIRRSYVEYNGYRTSVAPRLDFSKQVCAFTQTAVNYIGIVVPEVGKVVAIADSIAKTIELVDDVVAANQVGYELESLTNNPTDDDRGNKLQQRQWFTSRGMIDQYWKFDAKIMNSMPDSALVFKCATYDYEGWVNYNTIKYTYLLESEAREEAYLTYGGKVQIAMLNGNQYEQADVCYFDYQMMIGQEKSKEVTIFDNTTGYMLHSGRGDSFIFNPEYSGYYKFVAPAYTKIELYEKNSLIKSTTSSLDYIFDKNKSYKFVVKYTYFPQKSRSFNVFIEPYKFFFVNEEELNKYILKDSTESIIKLCMQESNLYEIGLYLNHNIATFVDFQIYDSSMNVIEKYKLENYDNQAFNTMNKQDISVYLEKDKDYYLVYHIIGDEKINFSISHIKDNINMDSSNELYSDIGDKFYSIDIAYSSRYKIDYSYINENSQMNHMMFVLLLVRNQCIDLYECKRVSDFNGDSTILLELLSGDKLYFGYFNGVSYISYFYSIVEYPQFPFEVTTEPSWATKETGLGTEVTVNNGIRMGKTIAVGFTRVLYLGNNAKYHSRYNDYKWMSENNDIATVSLYGTVFAKKPGVVKIRVSDKYDNNNIATIQLEIYEQNKYASPIILSTDVNEDVSLNGTEVKEYLGLPEGTTIHLGYTRSICIISGGPTNIRQDYNWSSSDDRIATVDAYGIVKAKSKGTVEITCKNKYDENYVGTIMLTIV